MIFFIVPFYHRDVSNQTRIGSVSHCENLNKEEMHPGVEKNHGEGGSHARS
jgi:hypothetical protein